MFIQDIKRGVPIVITFTKEEDKEHKEDKTEILAEFDGSIDHKKFYIKSRDIAENISNYVDTEAEFKYFDNGIFYMFTGKFVGKSSLAGTSDMIVDVVALTLLREVPRRNDIRISIRAKIKVHEFDGNRANAFLGSYIGDGITDNISKSGIRIWSNSELNQTEMPIYTLEIDIPFGDVYYIPAKLIYSQLNTIAVRYKFDYGLSLDFTHLPNMQELLIKDVLEARMRLEV